MARVLHGGADVSKTIVRVATTAVAVGTALAAPATAQEMWLGAGRPADAGLEVLRPSVRLPLESQSLTSVAVFLTGRLRLSPAYRLLVEIPVAFGKFSGSCLTALGGGPCLFAQSGSTIGNPYIGVESGADGASAFGEVGLRLPFASENQGPALLVGSLADLDRLEAFVPQVVTFSAFGNYRVATSSGFRFRLRAGPLLEFGASSAPRGLEAWIAYAVQAGYESGPVGLLAGLGGRASVAHAAQRAFTDQLTAALYLRLAGIKPGASLRLPLDDARDQIVGATIGLSLSVELP